MFTIISRMDASFTVTDIKEAAFACGEYLDSYRVARQLLLWRQDGYVRMLGRRGHNTHLFCKTDKWPSECPMPQTSADVRTVDLPPVEAAWRASGLSIWTQGFEAVKPLTPLSRNDLT